MLPEYIYRGGHVAANKHFQVAEITFCSRDCSLKIVLPPCDDEASGRDLRDEGWETLQLFPSRSVSPRL
ncbi:hypothetical protein CEXT_779221 [Caerostris extrusa]|uniref:Uncharacterized protein n=1 Tax=Caerostris extrusa TaxID=172846 RepID=A0AAV4X241_CAEEX|nr:hypothetical protein CEXT_779221 [Caerostris extrusa]